MRLLLPDSGTSKGGLLPSLIAQRGIHSQGRGTQLFLLSSGPDLCPGPLLSVKNVILSLDARWYQTLFLG